MDESLMKPEESNALTTRKPSRKLSPRQRIFAEEYLVDLNGKQAAIRAGYNPNSAEKQASRMLSAGKVSAHVEEALAQRSIRTGVTADRVLRELARLGFVKAPDIINMDDATLKEGLDDDIAAIASVRVKTLKTKDGSEILEREVKLTDKVKALELLGRHLSLFTDNLNVKNTDVKINILLIDEEVVRND